MLKARNTKVSRLKLGTNSPTGGRFDTWTESNAKVAPFWGHIYDGRHHIDEDITEIIEDVYGEGALGGARAYAAVILGPDLPGGTKRYQTVEGITDSNAAFAGYPGGNNRLMSALVEENPAQITSDFGDNCFAQIVPYPRVGNPEGPIISLTVRWENRGQTYFVAKSRDYNIKLEPDTKYWVSLELKSTGVVGGFWTEDPGANLEGLTPEFSVSIGKDYDPEDSGVVPPDEERKEAFDTLYSKKLNTFLQDATPNDDTQLTSITGLRWYPATT